MVIILHLLPWDSILEYTSQDRVYQYMYDSKISPTGILLDAYY